MTKNGVGRKLLSLQAVAVLSTDLYYNTSRCCTAHSHHIFYHVANDKLTAQNGSNLASSIERR